MLPAVAEPPNHNATLMAEPPDGGNLSLTWLVGNAVGNGGSPGTAAAMEDSAAMGGWIWIVLFAMVMVISVIANSVFVLAVLSNEKKHTVTHLLICLLFLINLVDYGLLIFEFILGISHHYPYGDSSCALYQFLLQGNPLLSSGTILLLIYQAHSSSSIQSSTASLLRWPRSSFSSCLLLTSVLLVSASIVSIPSALYSAVSETNSGARYCVMDLSSVAVWTGLGPGRGSIPMALYYLIYKSVLTYWLPMGLALPMVCRLYRMTSTSHDKHQTITLTLAVTASYATFYLLHAAIVFIRHVADIAEISISERTGWIISVAQSLFWLLATFSHFFRPMLCLLLDPDLKLDVCSLLGGQGYSSVMDYSAREGSNVVTENVKECQCDREEKCDSGEDCDTSLTSSV